MKSARRIGEAGIHSVTSWEMKIREGMCSSKVLNKRIVELKMGQPEEEYRVRCGMESVSFEM